MALHRASAAANAVTQAAATASGSRPPSLHGLKRQPRAIAEAALRDLVRAREDARGDPIRRDALERAISELVPRASWAETIARLRCLRGIDTLSAVGLCAEIGDSQRFDRPGLGPGHRRPAWAAPTGLIDQAV